MLFDIPKCVQLHLTEAGDEAMIREKCFAIKEFYQFVISLSHLVGYLSPPSLIFTFASSLSNCHTMDFPERSN